MLLYGSASLDPTKQRRAQSWLNALWENGAGVLSSQVLHEFYVNATRKLRSTPRQARSTVDVFIEWQPVERRDCRWLLSEDFQDGRKLGSVTVVNPFRTLPEEFGLRNGTTQS